MAKQSLTALVDELGRLDAELADARKLSKRSDEIKKILREHAEKRKPKPDKETEIAGAKYVATVGALPPRRSIRSMARLFTLMGQKLFLEVCSVTTAAIEKHLTAAQCADVLEDGHANTRPVTVRTK